MMGGLAQNAVLRAVGCRGKAWWIHSRMACPKFLRQTFQEFPVHSM